MIHLRQGMALGLLTIAILGGAATHRAQQQHRPAPQTQVDQNDQALSTAIASLKAENDTFRKQARN